MVTKVLVASILQFIQRLKYNVVHMKHVTNQCYHNKIRKKKGEKEKEEGKKERKKKKGEGKKEKVIFALSVPTAFFTVAMLLSWS